MNTETLRALLSSQLKDCQVTVNSEDNHHFDAVIISQHFTSHNTLERQQMVYKIVGDVIKSGELHAFSMKTYTPQEWEQMNG